MGQQHALTQAQTKLPVDKYIKRAYRKYVSSFDRPSVLLDLEKRMMFDGAAAFIVEEIFDDLSGSNNESLPNPVEKIVEQFEQTSVPQVEGIVDDRELVESSQTEYTPLTTVDVQTILEADGVLDSEWIFSDEIQDSSVSFLSQLKRI